MLAKQNEAVSVISDGASWIVDTTTGKIPGDAITSGTIGGSTNVTTTGGVSAATLAAVGSSGTIATNAAGTGLSFSSSGTNNIFAANSAGTLGLGVSGATSAIQISANNTANTLTVNNNDVGIGTTAPTAILNVQGSTVRFDAPGRTDRALIFTLEIPTLPFRKTLAASALIFRLAFN